MIMLIFFVGRIGREGKCDALRKSHHLFEKAVKLVFQAVKVPKSPIRLTLNEQTKELRAQVLRREYDFSRAEKVNIFLCSLF